MTTAETRVRAALARIAADDCNAFITVDAEGAIAAAQAADRRDASGVRLGPLDGAIVAVKDNLDTAGVRTTSGSAVYADRVPTVDAPVVARLRNAGMIIIGKTHMTEMACGTTGTNAWLGDARNPRDRTRYPGGSSSGSAIAVASDLVRFAVGSDTSCSVRQPAAACGVVGMKPTFGRVSTEGMTVGYRTMDHVGPIASTVRDAAALLDAMSDGHRWSTTSASLDEPVARLRVGVLRGQFLDPCDADVQSAFADAVSALERAGCALGEVHLDLDLDQADDQVNAFGRDLARAHSADFIDADPSLMSDDFAFWLREFSAVTDTEYDASIEAQRRIRAMLAAVMNEWDVLVCPTLRSGAGLLADVSTEHRSMRMGNCSLWNITGQPSLTIPWGTADTGMPLGLLINARHGEDHVALTFGHALEQRVAS